MKKKLMGIFSVAALGLALVGCSNSKDEDKDVSKSANDKTSVVEEDKELTLDATSYSFSQIGEAKEIVVKYGDDIVSDASISVKDDVVNVVSNVLISKKNGNSILTVSYKGKEVSATVKVSSNFSTEIEEEKNVINLKSGADKQISAKVTYPATIYEDLGVNYESSNPDVATVDKNGKITAVGQGIAKITAASNVEITEKVSAMGMTMISTSPAEDSITVIVDNEFDATVNKALVGYYEGYYDWQGFAEQASDSNLCWKESNIKWIRAYSQLTLNEDGSFVQRVLNAKRAGWQIVDANLPESTLAEQKAKYKNMYVYNGYAQKSSDFNDPTKVYADVVGYTEKGINNFAEVGAFAIFDGNLVLCYNDVQKELGAILNDAWLENAYVPYKNMVAMHEDMNMVLEKVEKLH